MSAMQIFPFAKETRDHITSRESMEEQDTADLLQPY